MSASRPFAPHRFAPRAQRGAIIVFAAFFILIAVIMLGTIDIGHFFYKQRDLQKTADMAAIAGAQALGPTDCASATTTARSNAGANGACTDPDPTKCNLVVECGVWTSKGGFTPQESGTNLNAVQVINKEHVPSFFGDLVAPNFGATPQPKAIAVKDQPIAAFSVGSRLLGLEGGLLNGILESTLGTSLGLKLLSYEGLANANVSLLGLKDALNLDFGTVDEVLHTDVTIGRVLSAVVDVLEHNGSAAVVDINALRTAILGISADTLSLPINLGDFLNVNVDSTDPQSALDVDVNAYDLLNVALQAANSRHAIDLQALNLNLLGLAAVNLKLAIIEPPVIAVGKPGPETVAHTAQVRLKLDISLLHALDAHNNLLSLLGLVTIGMPGGQLVDLPVNLELVPAEASLDSLQCFANGMHKVAIKAQPGIANAFVGNLPADAYGAQHKPWVQEIPPLASAENAYADLVSLRVCVLGLFGGCVVQADFALRAYSDLRVIVSAAQATILEFQVDPAVPVGEQEDMTQTVGTEEHMLAAIGGALTPNALVIDNNAIRVALAGISIPLVGNLVSLLLPSLGSLVGTVMQLLNTALMPVFNALDSNLVGPLLKALGIDVGAADVNLLDVKCNQARVVY